MLKRNMHLIIGKFVVIWINTGFLVHFLFTITDELTASNLFIMTCRVTQFIQSLFMKEHINVFQIIFLIAF